jgi:RNA polymerase sigma-70 factor (ECF subfamily)
VVDAFFAAAGSGDLAGLLALLAPDVELHAINREGVTVVHGPEPIAAQAHAARAGAASGAVLRPVTARGAVGVLILVNQRPITLMAFTVHDGLITRIKSVVDPDRLAQIVPSWAASC